MIVHLPYHIHNVFDSLAYVYTDADCNPGDQVEALILYLDTEARCVELSIDPNHIMAVKDRIENKFSAVSIQDG